MAKSPKPHRTFGFADFLWRWVASLVLVLATYNPGGFSYVHWLREAVGGTGLEPMHFFVGAVLLAGWVVFLVATQNSLGTLGTIVGALLIGTGIWVLVNLGLVRADTLSGIFWLAEIALATLLAIGLSWSHIWRRLSGQLEVDSD